MRTSSLLRIIWFPPKLLRAERAVVRTKPLGHTELRLEFSVIHILPSSKRKDFSCEGKAREIT